MMRTDDHTDSSERNAFFDPDAFGYAEEEQKPGNAHKSTHTTSHLMAWYLCHFQGYHIHYKTYVPKNGFLGAVSYKTTWWLHC